MDPLRRTLLKDGRPTRIRPKGFDILLVLVQAQGRLVEKDELMKAVWPDSFVEEGNVTLQISLLRKALGDDGSDHRYICNIPGRGYQFVAAVKARPNAPPEEARSVPGAVATGAGLRAASTNTPPEGIPLAAGTTNGNGPPEGIPLAATPLAAGTTNRGTTSRNNLPLQPTRLIGRDEDVKRIKALLNDARMVTLMGAPGSGKTRLGIRTTRELAPEFSDGVFLIELAPIRDPDLVGSAIAQILGLQEMGTTPVVELLKGHLDGKRMLLLLDNFEHLLPTAVLIAELLASACEFKVLATSRTALEYLSEFWALKGVLEHATLVTPALENSAQVACGIGNFESAVKILAAAEVGRRMWAAPAFRWDQAANEFALEKARGKLDPAAFRYAWEEGSRMTLEEAMELARRELGLSPNQVGDSPAPDAVQYAFRDGS